jgi:thioredoxin 1
MGTSTTDLTEETFEETVSKEGIVLVDWWGAHCMPCRIFAPVFEAAAEAHPDVVFAKVDTQHNQGLAREFAVHTIPTLSVLRDGVLLFHQAGMLPRKALDDLVAQARALDMVAIRKEVEAQKAKAEGKATAEGAPPNGSPEAAPPASTEAAPPAEAAAPAEAAPPAEAAAPADAPDAA